MSPKAQTEHKKSSNYIMSYIYPRSISITFRAAAGLLLLSDAIYTVLYIKSAISGSWEPIPYLCILAVIILLLRYFYTSYSVNIFDEGFEYGRRSKKFVNFKDVERMWLIPAKGESYLTLILKTGEKHSLPKSLDKFPSLMNELEKRTGHQILVG